MMMAVVLRIPAIQSCLGTPVNAPAGIGRTGVVRRRLRRRWTTMGKTRSVTVHTRWTNEGILGIDEKFGG
jgi:hypothetical protein